MDVKNRYIFNILDEDALKEHKMAFISGPRQVGKTTLAKAYLESDQNYFNWDDDRFRKEWAKSAVNAIANRGKGPVILDEIHKHKMWKRKLKGLFDTSGDKLQIIVTGSAKLDLYRRGGDI